MCSLRVSSQSGALLWPSLKPVGWELVEMGHVLSCTRTHSRYAALSTRSKKKTCHAVHWSFIHGHNELLLGVGYCFFKLWFHNREKDLLISWVTTIKITRTKYNVIGWREDAWSMVTSGWSSVCRHFNASHWSLYGKWMNEWGTTKNNKRRHSLV